MPDRAVWKSKTGFLLAALGSAIGLGNIWRFPYMAYRNGGGAFLIPYFVALFVVGIPLLMVEFGLGHYQRQALPRALEKIHPRFAWIGWWAVSFVMFGIVAYYAVVIAWCGNYLVYSITQPWGDAGQVNTYFDQTFLGCVVDDEPFALYESAEEGNSDGGFRFGRVNWAVVVSLAFVWTANCLISRRHLHHGVELANKIFIPLLVALTAMLVVWSWGLEGASGGRRLFLEPDWTQVFRPQTWIDAFSQIFFTLSLGFGIMVAYASYLPEKSDIPTSAFLAAMGNCAFSVFAALAVFSAIGMLADDRGIALSQMRDVKAELAALSDLESRDPAAFANQAARYESLRATADEHQQFERQMQSFGLVFKTYPAIISQMRGPAGRAFGVLFFLSLVVAGISSSISIVEAFMAALADRFDWPRTTMAPLLCLAAFLLGVVFCTQSGIYWLDLVDHFITSYGLVLVAICEALIVGWVFPADRLRRHLDAHHQFRFGPSFAFVMRALITAVLMLTWYGLVQLDAAPMAAAIGRFALLASAVVLWVDEHWLDFDIRLVVPSLLIFLLDQALLAEVTERYGGYPTKAIVGIGLGWLAATLVIGVALSKLPRPSSSDEIG